METQPFNQIDNLTELLMELCASRSDPNVSSSEFCARLSLIVQEARSQGYKVGYAVAKEGVNTNVQPVTPEPPIAPVARQVTTKAPSLDDILRQQIREVAPKKRVGKLTEQERAKIYLDYLDVTKDREHAPPGWAIKQARFYKVSKATIYNIVKEYAVAVHAVGILEKT